MLLNINCLRTIFTFLNYFHIISIQLFDSVNHSMEELHLKAMY